MINKCLLLAKVSILLTFVSIFPEFCSAANQKSDESLNLMWQVQKDVTDQELEFLRGKGINLVQSFRLITWDTDEIKTYLDRMHKHNLGVIMSLASLSQKIGGNWVFDEDKVSVFINTWKNHPGVFAWHLFDEPCNRGNHEIPVSVQEDAYKFVKSIDQKHGIFLSWNGTSDWHYKFFSESSFDILDLHAYIHDGITDRQKSLVRIFKEHNKRSYPVIITIRAFNGPRHPYLPPDGLKMQYDFFFREHGITGNVGFYGWGLSKNRGISDVPEIMQQFRDLNF